MTKKYNLKKELSQMVGFEIADAIEASVPKSVMADLARILSNRLYAMKHNGTSAKITILEKSPQR